MIELASIKNILAHLKPELKQKYFVSSIGLFGSMVRGDFTNKSDIDIIVGFTKPIGIEFIDLADYIESKLSKKVDLVSRNGVKQNIFNISNLKLSMSKREPSLLVEDIIDSANKILDYTANLSFEGFTKDGKRLMR